jgi:hypothetical protein
MFAGLISWKHYSKALVVIFSIPSFKSIINLRDGIKNETLQGGLNFLLIKTFTGLKFVNINPCIVYFTYWQHF